MTQHCPFCGTQVSRHCTTASCTWLRCPRCYSYGLKTEPWTRYDKGSAFNLYSLQEVHVVDHRTLPSRRQAIAGYTD